MILRSELSVLPVVGQMRHVCLAMVPGIIISTWTWGLVVLFHCVIAAIVAVGCEVLVSYLRGRKWVDAVDDNSVFVTAIILGLAITPSAPWWMVATASALAILLGKHSFGGLGQNPFNPAMLGYALVLVSWPEVLSRWPEVSLTTGVDGIAAATVLDEVKQQLRAMQTLDELQQNGMFGFFAARSWEWINLGFLLGGVWLLYKRIIHWVIPAGMLLGLTLPAVIFHVYTPDLYVSASFHLFSGATMIGVFFIATDPVSSPAGGRAQFVYGLGIGCLVFYIRTFGDYPDGIAFAVLLMNALTPLLDRSMRVRKLHND